MPDNQVIKFKNEELYREKLDCLVSGGCRGIFPVSIVEEEGAFKGFYKTSGYKKISMLKSVEAAETLMILEKTLDAVEECRQHLIFPEEFIISTDTAYTDGGFKTVKFTYMPGGREESFNVKISGFTESLKKITTENGRLYLDMMKELFSTENLSKTRLKAVIVKLRQEIKTCGII